MLQHGRSPSSSPIRKRQRLSSPTYDDQMAELTPDYLDAFDEIEFKLSQLQPPLQEVQNQPLLHADTDDSDSPFLVNTAYISPLSQPSSSQPATRAKEPLLPPLDALPLFQSAKSVDVSRISDPAPPTSSFSNKENDSFYLRPSETALKAAQTKLKTWERDWEDLLTPEEEEERALNALSDLATGMVAPITFGSPMVPGTGREMLPPVSTPLPQPSRLGFKPLVVNSQPRPFRPLTIKAPANVPTSFLPPAPTTSQAPQTPRSNGFSTPGRLRRPLLYQTPQPSTSTPVRPRQPLHLSQMPKFSPVPTPRSVGISKMTRSTFVSPFRTQKPSRSSANPLLKTQLQNRVYPPAGRPSSPLAHKAAVQSTKSKSPVSIPSSLSNRETLLSSGLRPQQYSKAELEGMGLNLGELVQVKPSTALHYCFYSFSPEASSSSQEADAPILLNAAAAYEELKKEGCRLATEEWVNNHWCLILWKLAGMAALDPDSEQEVDKKRWCWKEVMRQLRYRYDKELDRGNRPILRKIVAQDTSANIPLVLCVSAVLDVDGQTMLEVTDGWYRLRAEIDAPLARAVGKGIIREGRKIIVSGARLNSEKKDPMEILEAYNSVTLKLWANSSNMAPWHAKLGVHRRRYISTLHALTSDGGVVSCLDFEILKVHPVGYIEFIKEDGRTAHIGPRNEAEEARAADKWMKLREKEASKLRQDHEKRVLLYTDYLSRLERKAQKCQRIGEDEDCPDNIDNYYDDLENHQMALHRINSITPLEAYWLAQVVSKNLTTEYERIAAQVEQDLDEKCPPRDVKNFRVLVVKDARTDRRPSNRVAQLTVWDASHFDMSSSGSFAPGQRYLVGNLMPTQRNAWMKDEPGAEVFMQTCKDSQWLKRKPIG